MCVIAVVTLVPLLLTACGDNSQQARETLVSWSKSLDLLEQQYAQRRVPETYVHQMLRAATRALNQYRKILPNDPAVRDLDAKIRRLSSSADSSSAGRRLSALPPQ